MNIILFEKFFRKITNDLDLVYKTKFSNFIPYFEKYNIKQHKFLKYIISSKLEIAILLNYDISELINIYCITSDCPDLALINDHDNFPLFVDKIHSLDNAVYSTRWYFLLRIKLVPTLNTYRAAIIAQNLEIIKDISNVIALIPELVEIAFDTGNHEIIKFIIDTADMEKLNISIHLYSYLLLHQYPGIVIFNDPLCTNNLFAQAAILSGNIMLAEKYYINIDNIYDKKNTSVITEDTLYKGKYSHCMNYAVQSDNVEMCKYIYNLGHGISVSNFVSAIKIGNIEIIKFLLSYYNGNLSHIIPYLGPSSYSKNKEEIARLLWPRINYFLTAKEKRKTIVYLKLVQEEKITCDTDNDYLFSVDKFLFNDRSGRNSPTHQAQLDVAFFKYSTLFNEDLSLIKNNEVVFYYGTIDQLKSLPPRKIFFPLVIEILIRNQLGKIINLHQNNLLEEDEVYKLYSISQGLNNITAIEYFKKYLATLSLIKHQIYRIVKTENTFITFNGAIISRNKNLLLEYYKHYQDVSIIKTLLRLEDTEVNEILGKDVLELYKDFLQENDIILY